MLEYEKNALILLRRKLAASRADIARLLGISRPTASNIVQSMLDSGMIKECGKGRSTGGTSPIKLAICPEAAFTVGIDLGYNDRMIAVLLDNAGDIIESTEVDFNPESMENIALNIRNIRDYFSSRKKISAMAFALSGIVDEERQYVTDSINPLYKTGNLYDLLKDIVEVPFIIGNRSRMAAFSEAFGGAGNMESDFIVISLGRSVGAAFWCDNRLFKGRNFAAGEIRNMLVDGNMTLEDAIKKARKNKNMDKIANICADAMTILSDIMDIDFFILSGAFADLGTDFAQKLENMISLKRSAKVRSARYGKFSAARGCAFLAEEKIL